MENKITIVSDILIVGSDGLTKKFIHQEQYDYSSIVKRLKKCDECSNLSTSSYLRQYYVVTINTVDYEIPFEYAVVWSYEFQTKYAGGAGGKAINKEIYEQINKDESYPANGDYQGYMKQKLGLVQSNKPDFSGENWLRENTTKVVKTRGENKDEN